MYPHAPTPVPAAPHDAPAVLFDLRWTAQDLADAVRLRPLELARFDAAPAAANQPASAAGARRAWRNGYAPRRDGARLFRIQG